MWGPKQLILSDGNSRGPRERSRAGGGGHGRARGSSLPTALTFSVKKEAVSSLRVRV